MRAKRRVFQIALALVLSLGLALTGLGIVHANAEDTVEWSAVSIEAEYGYGETFAVPARTVTVNGTQQNAAASLVRPDGSGVRGNQVKLDMPGTWKVNYSALVNGKIYLKEETFEVVNPLYFFSGPESKGEFVPADPDSKLSKSAYLKLSLGVGETVTFTPVIDINNVTSSDVLAYVFAAPENAGAAEFNLIEVRLTDVEDPSVYLTYTGRGLSELMHRTYCLAGASTQGDLVGYEAGWDRVHRNNQYGTQVSHSFWATPSGNNGQDNNGMAIGYDSTEKSAYVSGVFVVDLDDPKYFPGNPFAGFPSGKVRLSLSADLVTGRYANIGVTKIMGVDDLSVKEYPDTEAPSLRVDVGDADPNNMPDAVVGGTYPVPTATAFDFGSGSMIARVTVWRNYSGTSPISVPITDGKFKVEYAGTYTIEVSATDAFGNEAKQLLRVEAKDSVPEVQLTVDTATADKEASLGEWVKVPEYSVTGGSGNVHTVITAVSPDASFTLDDGVYGFRPEIEGDYVVTYTATDYIGRTDTVSYTVNAKRGTVPVFAAEPELPNHFFAYYNSVVGDFYEYTMPYYYANDYTSGKLEYKLATATVVDAAGSRPVAAGEKFSPRVNSNGDEVTITFTCGKAEPKVVKVPTIVPYKDVDGDAVVDISRYFLTDGASVAINATGSTVSATEENGSWTYAMPVLAEGTQVTFAGKADKANYKALRIVLTDMYDPSIAVEAQLRFEGMVAMIYAVGENTVRYANTFMQGVSGTFGFDGTGFSFGDVRYVPATTVSGDPFDGFPSHKVYVSVGFVDAVPGEAEYSLSFVDNQPILETEADYISSRIAFLGDRGGTYEVGSVITLPAAIASDALAPSFGSQSLTVTAPDGNFATAEDGTVLNGADPTKEYRLRVTAYGQYSATVSFTDSNDGPPTNTYYTINVLDNVAPEIKFNHDFTETATVGDTLVIPAFTVTDNVSTDDKIVVVAYVRTAAGRLVMLDQGYYAVAEGSNATKFGARSNSIKATTEGDYVFIISAVDDAGNTCRVMKTVKVTAATQA